MSLSEHDDEALDAFLRRYDERMQSINPRDGLAEETYAAIVQQAQPQHAEDRCAAGQPVAQQRPASDAHAASHGARRTFRRMFLPAAAAVLVLAVIGALMPWRGGVPIWSNTETPSVEAAEIEPFDITLENESSLAFDVRDENAVMSVQVEFRSNTGTTPFSLSIEGENVYLSCTPLDYRSLNGSNDPADLENIMRVTWGSSVLVDPTVANLSQLCIRVPLSDSPLGSAFTIDENDEDTRLAIEQLCLDALINVKLIVQAEGYETSVYTFTGIPEGVALVKTEFEVS